MSISLQIYILFSISVSRNNPRPTMRVFWERKIEFLLALIRAFDLWGARWRGAVLSRPVRPPSCPRRSPSQASVRFIVPPRGIQIALIGIVWVWAHSMELSHTPHRAALLLVCLHKGEARRSGPLRHGYCSLLPFRVLSDCCEHSAAVSIKSCYCFAQLCSGRHY